MPDSEMSAEILMDDDLRAMLKDLAVPFELRKAIVRYGTAARQQGIEDAAKMAQSYGIGEGIAYKNLPRACEDIAAAIRALSHNKD